MPLCPNLNQPLTSMSNVLQFLTDLDKSLGDNDGLKWFNRLYLKVTEAVSYSLLNDRADWKNPQWIERLDVEFACLYQEALRKSKNGIQTAPSAWRPLLSAREDTRIHRLQFALAGMNAHINRDLPVVLSNASAYPTASKSLADEYVDFLRVNEILAKAEQTAKEDVSVGIVRAIDVGFKNLDDILALWNVRVARNTAWMNGLVVAKLPVTLRDDFIKSIDKTVGALGRGILVHIHGAT